jgi:hypothetical protein
MIGFVVAMLALDVQAAMVNISNVEPRRDTSGEIMDMHDGNMHIGEDGTYYWYAAGYGGCPEKSGPTGCKGGFHGCGFYNNHSEWMQRICITPYTYCTHIC